jgi:uncharacterized membrane protein
MEVVMRTPSSRPLIAGLAKSNIEKVLQIEQQSLSQRSQSDRLSDGISALAGSLSFVIAHVIALSGWISLNSRVFPGVPVVDPYPFSFLAMVVSVEVIFLSAFVLMSQNRQRHQADHWAHLDLQLSLLAEQEATKTLQLIQAICDHLGLKTAASDQQLQEMIGTTHVGILAQELAKGLERTRELEKGHGTLANAQTDGKETKGVPR